MDQIFICIWIYFITKNITVLYFTVKVYRKLRSCLNYEYLILKIHICIRPFTDFALKLLSMGLSKKIRMKYNFNGSSQFSICWTGVVLYQFKSKTFKRFITSLVKKKLIIDTDSSIYYKLCCGPRFYLRQSKEKTY